LPNSLTHFTIGSDIFKDSSFKKPLFINGKSVLPDSLECFNFYGSEIDDYSGLRFTITHNAFTYNTKIYFNDDDITKYIHILKNIDDSLPMPIAEEIIDNIFIGHVYPKKIKNNC